MAKNKTKLEAAEAAFLRAHRAEMACEAASPSSTPGTPRARAATEAHIRAHARLIAATDRARVVRNALREEAALASERARIGAIVEHDARDQEEQHAAFRALEERGEIVRKAWPLQPRKGC